MEAPFSCWHLFVGILYHPIFEPRGLSWTLRRAWFSEVSISSSEDVAWSAHRRALDGVSAAAGRPGLTNVLLVPGFAWRPWGWPWKGVL